MYLCRELTDTSLPQIGNFFGGRDHTTVLHAYDKIAKEREENAKLQDYQRPHREHPEDVNPPQTAVDNPVEKPLDFLSMNCG